MLCIYFYNFFFLHCSKYDVEFAGKIKREWQGTKFTGNFI